MNARRLALFRALQMIVVLALALSLTGGARAAQGTLSGNWEGSAVRKATVLLEPDGYRMWYDGVDFFDQTQIGLATSADGVSWTKYSDNPVLSGGPEAWDSTGEHAPFVMKDGGLYKMWYEGSDGNVRQLGYATSPDGINWTKYDGNPVLHAGPEGYDQNVAGHGSVLYEDGVYKLWYHAIGDQGILIAYATSPDGVDWTKMGPVLSQEAGLWDEGGLWGPSVLHVGDTYWMWYSAGSPIYPTSIGVATSPDGENWTRFGDAPIITVPDHNIGDPQVILDGGTYKMWFNNFNDGKIYYAESPDGINWSGPSLALSPGALSPVVGVVLPSSSEPRWQRDAAELGKALQAQGLGTEILYSEGDPATEQANVETLISHGIQVLIICPVDATATAAFEAARAAGVKIISYDRLILDTDAVDFYVTFDGIDIGRAQGEYLIGYAQGTGNPLYLYGGATWDNNSFLFFEGAWEALQPYIADGTFVIKNSSEAVNLQDHPTLTRDQQSAILNQITTNWSYDDAKNLAAANLAAIGPADKGNVFILAPNDTTARAIGDTFAVDPDVRSYILTGQDAEQDSVQYIIFGRQSMTVFKDIRTLAGDAVSAAVDFLQGKTPTPNKTYYNGMIDVPAHAASVVVVDRSNLQTALFDTGYYQASDFNWPNPWFTVFPEQDVVEGWDWPLGQSVHLAIDDPNTSASPDYEQDQKMVFTPWGSGQLWVWFEFPGAYDVKPGDVVTLTDGLTPRTHVVQNLSITSVDSVENTVRGTADTGQTVALWSWEDPQGNRLQTTADKSRNWAADFDAVSFDLVPGYHVRAEVWVEGNDTAVDREVRLNYDIYAYDPTTGATQRITKLTETDEYNPAWSPDGKKVAHDVLFGDGTQTIYITNVATGVSTPLKGAGNGGNDVAWSPSGSQIVFDRYWVGDANLYSLPAAGGKPKLLRHDASSAAWSPNGKFLAFRQPSDGSIRTVFFASPGGTARFIGYGENPAWSPDGKWIAYEKDGDIWKVAVDKLGAALGGPVQLTSGPFFDDQPTWSRDSRTIIYHSGMTGDYDLWSVPAAGGDPTWLTGAPNFGDYDPAQAKSNPKIAYTSFSPDGQAARSWGAAFIYGPVTWEPGEHSYYFENAYSVPEIGGETTPMVTFSVSDDAPSYDGFVLLRGLALRARVGEECPVIDPNIRPDQNTLFHYGWQTAPMTYQEALAHFDSLTVTAHWDDGMSADLLRHEIFSWSSADWVQYICSAAVP